MYMSGRDAQSCRTVFKSPDLMQVLGYISVRLENKKLHKMYF